MGYLSRHNVHRIFVSSLLFTIVSFMNCVKAQVVDDTMHVVNATLADRISLRTNSVDWLLLTPNVGVEFAVRKENWNRWAVGLNVKGRWKGSNTFKPGVVYNLNEIRVDFKNYWRERFVRGEGSHALDGNVDPHIKWFDKLFSMRRKNLYNEADPKHTYPYLKHPAIVFFRGLYAAYDKFSLKAGGKKGYQGDAISIGGTYGIIRTLHEYEKGGRLDMELGVSAGWMFLIKCQEYSLDRVTNNYIKGANKDVTMVPYPIPTDLRLGLVYHFGKMPLTRQYRWRYDADSAFHVLVDSIAADRQAKWEQKQIDKSFKIYIQPVKSIIADARNTLNGWPDSLYSYPRMVLERAIEQAVRDSSEILQPVYVNKGIVYDKDGEQKIEIIKRELEYYKNRASSYVEKDRRIKFVADSLYADSVKRVLDDSVATAKRNKFVADSLRRDSVSNAKRFKFLNDSIMKDSLKQAKAALKDSLNAAKLEAKQRAQMVADSLKAAGQAVPDSLAAGVEDAEGARQVVDGDMNSDGEVVPIEPTESENSEEQPTTPTDEGQATPNEESNDTGSTDNNDNSSDSNPEQSNESAPEETSTGQSSEETKTEDSESNEQPTETNTEGNNESTENSNSEEGSSEESNNEE